MQPKQQNSMDRIIEVNTWSLCLPFFQPRMTQYMVCVCVNFDKLKNFRIGFYTFDLRVKSTPVYHLIPQLSSVTRTGSAWGWEPRVGSYVVARTQLFELPSLPPKGCIGMVLKSGVRARNPALTFWYRMWTS